VMNKFQDLKVWQKAHQLTLNIYEITQYFPKEERYGLISQIRRSAASVPANISEGCGRHRDTEFFQLLNIALGSAKESEYHLILARDLKLINVAVFEKLNDELQEIKKMLVSLKQRLKAPS